MDIIDLISVYISDLFTRNVVYIVRILLFIFVACFVMPLNSDASIGCRTTLNGTQLTNSGVYYAKVSDGTELIPSNGGWVFSNADDKIILVCLYGRTVLAVKLPAAATNCLVQQFPQIICR